MDYYVCNGQHLQYYCIAFFPGRRIGVGISSGWSHYVQAINLIDQPLEMSTPVPYLSRQPT